MYSKKATLPLLLSLCATLFPCDEERSIPYFKKWTFMVYMEAANDLEVFAPRNMRQMQQIGSNDMITLVVQHNTVDRHPERNIYHSQTFLIEKDGKRLLKERESTSDTGEEKLIEFCCDTIATYTADHYALILWNHGTGPIEPVFRNTLSSSDLFSISNSSDLFEKENRGFSPLQTTSILPVQHHHKGICFNDTSGKFLTERHLCRALKTICATALNDGKFDLLGFDACLMSMIEIALAIEPYAKTMVASQDVERGTGWNYYYVLFPFSFTSLTPEGFGNHIVSAYQKTYQRIADFTLSCLLLEKIQDLAHNISRVAGLLHRMLTVTENKRLKLSVKASRNKHLCTHFDEPEFIDLHHFYRNLFGNLEQIIEAGQQVPQEVEELKRELLEGGMLIEKTICANTVGSAYPHAKGISVYFPEHTIHSSYRRCTFASQTHWLTFLKTYLSAYKK